MLWLALHFPLLPLEALPLRQSPSAVVARGRVLVGDRDAMGAGVCAGQKLSTALGLLPGLAAFERDEKRERQTLESLACWAGQFTPTISLAPPDTMLLEIGRRGDHRCGAGRLCRTVVFGALGRCADAAGGWLAGADRCGQRLSGHGWHAVGLGQAALCRSGLAEGG